MSISICVFSLPAFADSLPSAAQTAGSEEKRFREESLLEERAKAPVMAETAPIESDAPIHDSPVDPNLKFKIKEVRFVGNDSIPTRQLKPLVRDIVSGSDEEFYGKAPQRMIEPPVERAQPKTNFTTRQAQAPQDTSAPAFKPSTEPARMTPRNTDSDTEDSAKPASAPQQNFSPKSRTRATK